MPRLSPDGTRVALDIRDQDNDIWILDLARQTLARLTVDPGIDQYPVWTPDGRRIIYSSSRAGSATMFWQPADGTGTAEQLSSSTSGQFPISISPDGARLIFRENPSSTGFDVMMLTLAQRQTEPLIRTTFQENNGQVSPDGRWLAYESNESGRYEIYVRPFPNVNSGRWPISAAGGCEEIT